MKDFDELIASGNCMLNSGDFEGAKRAFYSTFSIASEDQLSIAQHYCAVSLQLNGELRLAERLFRKAIKGAEDVVQAAKIKRNLGACLVNRAMADCDISLLDEAEKLFISSRNELSFFGQDIESAVSDGFVGRVQFLTGRKHEAEAIMVKTYYAIAGRNCTYELDNLIWLARVSFGHRWRYATRAFELMNTIPAKQRRLEYIVILVGGDLLYRRIFASKGV